MARMLRAQITQWQRWTACPRRGGWTYAYDVKSNVRAREERSWRREWAADVDYAWYARNTPVLIDLGLIN